MNKKLPESCFDRDANALVSHSREVPDRRLLNEGAMQLQVPDCARSVKSYSCAVAEHRWVNGRYKYIRLEGPEPLANKATPGQFYQLKCPQTVGHQPFLLRPMSVYGVGPSETSIEFLYSVTGVGTKALSELAVGDHMEIVGPLGNTFTMSAAYRHIVVVARGVGLATMAPLVKKAAVEGVRITAVMSARSARDLMQQEFLRGAVAKVYTVFDDEGTSCVDQVQELLTGILDRECPDAIYTCGSHRLLMLIKRLLASRPAVAGEVALEQRMACGMGVCLSCVRMFDNGADKRFLRVCREGPVFPIREVVGEVEFG